MSDVLLVELGAIGMWDVHCGQNFTLLFSGFVVVVVIIIITIVITTYHMCVFVSGLFAAVAICTLTYTRYSRQPALHPLPLTLTPDLILSTPYFAPHPRPSPLIITLFGCS